MAVWSIRNRHFSTNLKKKDYPPIIRDWYNNFFSKNHCSFQKIFDFQKITQFLRLRVPSDLTICQGRIEFAVEKFSNFLLLKKFV